MTIGGFEIIRMIGEGGMGEVYLARQLSLGRNVALKILPAQMKLRRGAAERFFKEVKLLARLDHANIVIAHEAGEDAGVMYLAMGYVDGESLEQKLKRSGPMMEDEALRIGAKLAGALDYAWTQHKLLHRDIKPSNVMLTASGELKLMDFGLAKCLQDDQALTLSGSVMGTPNYMSPEQVEGKVDLDCRADLYSLGATLYHMVTGKLPFAGSSVMETLRKQVGEMLPDPRTVNPAVSENCVTLIEIMLSKDREQRHPDYKTLMDDIERVRAGQPPMREPLQAGQSVLLRAQDLGISRAPKPAANRKLLAKSNRNLIIGVAAGIAVVLVAGMVLVLGVRGPKQDAAKTDGAKNEGAVSAETARAESMPASEVKPQQDAARANLTKQFMEALTFSREHPEDYAGALVLLEPLGKAAAGTELEGKINDEIGRVGRVRKQAVDKALTALKEEVESKVAAGDYDGALKRIELDTGLVTEETKAARAELDREVKAKKQADAELKLKRAEEALQQKQAALAQEKLAALAQGVAADLLKGDPAGMIQKLTAAKSDPALEKVAGEVSDLSDMALQAAGWAERVAKTFNESRGRPVTVEFKGGRKETITVTSVSGDKIRSQRKLGPGLVGFDFSLADLSVDEQLKRLGDDPRPAMKVTRGLVYVKCANDWTSAGKEFASASGKLAEALAREAPGGQAPAAERDSVKPVEKPAVEKPAVEAKEALPVVPGKLEVARRNAAHTTTPPDEDPAPVALKPATEETIKAAIEKLEMANGVKMLSKYKITSDGIELDLIGNMKLHDLRALAGVPLAKLTLVNAPVKDLRPLVGMPLVDLTIDTAPIDSIKPLGKIKTLQVLRLSKTGIDDLTPLAGLQLTDFACTYDRPNQKTVRDLTPLAGMPIRKLGVTFSESASPAEMAANIELMKNMPIDELHLNLSGIKDIKFLEDFSSVKRLRLDLDQVGDLSPLRGMKLLSVLRLASARKVADLNALKGMELTIVQLLDMNITSLEPLAVNGDKIGHLMIVRCPKLADTDRIPEYFPNLTSITIDPDFPRPEILTQCANLKTVTLRDGATPITMDEFKKRYGKPGKTAAAGAKAAVAGPAGSGKSDIPRALMTPDEDPAPVALKPATEETIKAAVAKLEKDNGIKVNSKYKIAGDGIELEFSGNTKLCDLKALAGLPVVRLNINWSAIKDLRPLAGMPLENLRINASPLDNIKPVASMKALKVLELIDTGIDDLAPLKGLQLTDFACSANRYDKQNNVRDLAPLSGMPIEKLNVAFSDATTPAEMAANIAIMKDMSLDSLFLKGAVIKDVSFLEGFASVKRLVLGQANVSDLSPLRAMRSLVTLQIEDCNKLAGLDTLKGINAMSFQLIRMNVKSLEPLAGEKVGALYIVQCPKLTDTDRIPEYFPNLKQINIDQDFPRPEILLRCANLEQVVIGEGGGKVYLTMDQFRKKYAKPAKNSSKK
jgi:serine/threonine-protein kinase